MALGLLCSVSFFQRGFARDESKSFVGLVNATALTHSILIRCCNFLNDSALNKHACCQVFIIFYFIFPVLRFFRLVCVSLLKFHCLLSSVTCNFEEL